MPGREWITHGRVSNQNSAKVQSLRVREMMQGSGQGPLQPRGVTRLGWQRQSGAEVSLRRWFSIREICQPLPPLSWQVWERWRQAWAEPGLPRPLDSTRLSKPPGLLAQRALGLRHGDLLTGVPAQTSFPQMSLTTCLSHRSCWPYPTPCSWPLPKAALALLSK